MEALRQRIEAAFEARAQISPTTVDAELRADVERVIDMLDRGEARVAEKLDGQWHVHQWLKKAVLLSFRIFDNGVIDGAETKYFDKVPQKFADYDEARFRAEAIRVVPPAAVRKGSFIGKNTVLMPSYVNLGAYVDEAPWSTPGPRLAPVRKLVKTCISPAVSVSVAYSSRCRPAQPLLKTTALSVPALKSLKG